MSKHPKRLPTPPAAEEVQKWVHASGITCGTIKEKTHHHNYSYSDDTTIWVKVSRTNNADFANREYETTKLLKDLGHPVPVALTQPTQSPHGSHIFTVWEYIPSMFPRWPGWTEERLNVFWEKVQSLHYAQVKLPTMTIPNHVRTTVPSRLNCSQSLHPAIKKDILTTLNTLLSHWDEVFQDAELVFSHGDVHPQNAIWTSDTNCVLIDWEMAKSAPLEWDLMCVYRNITNSKQPDAHTLGEKFLQRFPTHKKEGFTTALYVKTLSHLSYFALVGKKDKKIEKSFTILKGAMEEKTINFPFPLKEYYK